MVLVVLAFFTAAAGALGGIGGAVLLVPALVVLRHMPTAEAAPLGLVSVIAGSVAAGPRQLGARLVNHRLGVTTELMASSGAVVGALASASAPDRVLRWVLAIAALGAAVGGAFRRGLRNPPDPNCRPSDVGERVGSLDGAYPLGDQIVPYRAKNLVAGLGAMGMAGLVAGLSGTSGGFIKTPVTTEVMRVPQKVAGATTVFTGGITTAAALCVVAAQGRVDPHDSALVIVGALIGGQLGAHGGTLLSPAVVRRFLTVVLVLVAVLLVSR